MAEPVPLLVSTGKKLAMCLDDVTAATGSEEALSKARMYVMQVNDILEEDYAPICTLTDEQRDVIVRFHKEVILEHWDILNRPATVEYKYDTSRLGKPFLDFEVLCKTVGLHELGQSIRRIYLRYDTHNTIRNNDTYDEATKKKEHIDENRRIDVLWDNFKKRVIDRYGLKMINIPSIMY
jgi:hypothetical protein